MKKENAVQFFRHVCNIQALAGLASYSEALELYKKLHRLEVRIRRENEAECNGTLGLTEAEIEAKDERRMKKYQSLLPGVDGLLINSDPRGYALKMSVVSTEKLRAKNIDLFVDWGKFGILAPDF